LSLNAHAGIGQTHDFYYNVAQMARGEYLGPFEQLVLGAILALQHDAYGVTIHSKVEQLSRPRRVSLGAIYVTLARLEDKGPVLSRLSAPTGERGGRAKRCYRLKAAGERALYESAVIAQRIWDSIAENGAEAGSAIGGGHGANRRVEPSQPSEVP
jgi:PadR family transcriptional regulator PadR